MIDTEQDATAHPLVSVIIVSLKGRKLLEQFLPSVLGMKYRPMEVILVDNASNDGSVEFVRDRYPQVKIVVNEENLGTAEGGNSGLPAAKGKYVFWISNDMEMDPDMLTYLVETASSNPTIGICTCKMRRILPDGTKLNVIDSVGASMDIFGTPAARGINEVDKGQWDFPADVFFSFGGALLIKRSVLEQIKGYDPRIFTLGDDIDICWRVLLLGYRVVADPRAVLYHRVSVTLGKYFSRSNKRFLAERGAWIGMLKNYSGRTLAFVVPSYLVILTGEVVFLILAGKGEMGKASIKAVIWNLRNLPETIIDRRVVKANRRVTDRELRRLMLPGCQKIRVFQDYLANRNNEEWRNYFGTKTTITETIRRS